MASSLTTVQLWTALLAAKKESELVKLARRPSAAIVTAY